MFPRPRCDESTDCDSPTESSSLLRFLFLRFNIGVANSCSLSLLASSSRCTVASLTSWRDGAHMSVFSRILSRSSCEQDPSWLESLMKLSWDSSSSSRSRSSLSSSEPFSSPESMAASISKNTLTRSRSLSLPDLPAGFLSGEPFNRLRDVSTVKSISIVSLDGFLDSFCVALFLRRRRFLDGSVFSLEVRSPPPSQLVALQTATSSPRPR